MRTASEVLDRHFLEARARILEVAAILDRIDRAEGEIEGDPNVDLLHRGIKILLSGNKENLRAEQVQKLFSRSYAEDWRKEMEV